MSGGSTSDATSDATALRARLAARELSCRELALELLDALAEDEHQAWAAVDGDLLLRDAAALDQLGEHERRRLPLFGLPVGVKDNFDTAELPTAYGSPIYAGHRPTADAAVVAGLRNAGALIAGKTRCTEFAWMNPTDTRNPLAPDRTPGGSSSGSAAAVAAGTVPLATGTQTAGSINRPASYCGVVGFKPTAELLPSAGVKPLAPSLDTVGMLARSARDVELVLAALTASPGPNSPPAATPAAAQIVFARTPCWDAVEPEARHAIERIVSSLGLREVVLPESFVALVEAQTTIQSYEAARALAAERASSPELLSDWLRTALAEADELVPADYEAARTVAERDGPRVNDVLRSHGAILVPSATGVPPLGLHQTGDPLFCRVWTLIGAPSLSLPLAWTDDGLPAGLQLVGARGSDRALLAAAVRLGLGSD